MQVEEKKTNERKEKEIKEEKNGVKKEIQRGGWKKGEKLEVSDFQKRGRREETSDVKNWD